MTTIEIQASDISVKTQHTSELDRKSLTNNPASKATKNGTKKTTKKVAVTTLGCKVNSYESELITETLKTDDWQPVPSSDKADLYLINTCTVTREADRQARQEVRKAVKRNPEALVVVTGCYAQMDAEAVAAIPGVDLVLGNDRKLDLHRLMPELNQGTLPKILVGDLDEHLSLPSSLLTGYEAHTRAFVQIQQGCDQGCTFCIIHVARGPSRSFSPTLIKRQVQRLVMNGYPEIVICGVDLGSYGEDFDSLDRQFDLVNLLNELLQLEHDASNPFRIRLSSIDPHHISDRLIELFKNEPRLCPHIHLSLQSGCTLILKRMKRRYTADVVRQKINKLKTVIPDLVMSADVMVGFPTETEEHYLETEKMVKDLDIAFPHVFSYSEREGTPAARIPNNKQIDVAERKQRNKRLREVGQQLQADLKTRRLGKTAYVLAEKKAKRDGYMMCRSEDYLSVLVPENDAPIGRWQAIQYTDISDGFLIAKSIAKVSN